MDEEKARLAQVLLAQLDELAGAFAALDPVAGQALVSFAVLARGGREDLILAFTHSVRAEVARIIEAAFAEAELMSARPAD